MLFGVPEVALILLIIVWFSGSRKHFPYKKYARWGTLVTGMVVLGFLYNQPLIISFISKMLMEFWPEWQNALYWYGLIGFIVVVFLINGKNPYCQWMCPFGAVQETVGMIGGAKIPNTIGLHIFFVGCSAAWLCLLFWQHSCLEILESQVMKSLEPFLLLKEVLFNLDYYGSS